MTKFSCFLIGNDTLLVECAQVLLDEGHEVRGVITTAPRVREFCRRNDLQALDAESDYATPLRGRPFDYLFAITHLAIIPDAVLALPEKMAVNFHDGPLPRYAGLNAPVWALINRELEYGVSWHVITSGVDEGDVLEQHLFEVAPDETALSLNTKCMAAALASFPELVSKLSSGQASPVAQDLSRRSYFGKYDRPKHACLIDWNSPSDEIDALVRALTFGPYTNPVGVAKALRVGATGDPFVVTSVTVTETAAPPSAVPGQVLDIDETGIRVSTGDRIVVITGARTLVGSDLPTSNLGLRVGDRLATGDSEVARELAKADAEGCRHERFWRERLEAGEAPELPFAAGPTESEPDWLTLPWSVPDDLPSTFGDQGGAAIFAAFAIYLARVGSTGSFHISVADSAARHGISEVDAFHANSTPHVVDLDSEWTPRAVVEALSMDLDEGRRRGSYPLDLIQRDPSLISRPELVDGVASPVGVAFGEFELDEPVGSVISLLLDDDACGARLVFDRNRITEEAAAGILGSLSVCLHGIATGRFTSWTELPLVTDADLSLQIKEWNATDAEYERQLCVHQAFEGQVDRTPDADAVVFEGQGLSYRELDERANRLARHLRKRGVAPGSMVGVHVARSTDLMVATLGVMKAGGAYLPLDPDFPPDRLSLMIEDSGVRLLVTQSDLEAELPLTKAEVLRIDADWPAISSESMTRPKYEVTSADLAYVIYTSGSTGRPKGVLVEHRNVVNFFVGMDAVVDRDPPGVWLAVTSLSFDISVLELFWTLTRGFTVVIYADATRNASGDARAPIAPYASRPMGFGLFMWGNDEGPGPDKYRLMLEGAKFFDRNGFDSVWTPERHFHAFGGPFPNPSVTSAAIAAVTERIGIRSGSCVSPLHHPIRVAEEWAVVDNLSGGRVGLSFAAGWQPNDFVIRPGSFPDQKKIMFEQIETIRRLWRGEAVEFESPLGHMIPITTLPRPVQPELPFWITTAGNLDSYGAAGTLGANVLTHLLGQTLDEVEAKIDAYRMARREAGFDPDTGVVTLMLHTFVGDDDAEVREIVRQPMKDYLGASMKLVVGFAWSFPAFRRPGGADSTPDDLDLSTLSDDETEAILDFAFERYFETSGLFGTTETCSAMVDRCKAAGVDEIACLLDFGVDTEFVMRSLPDLKLVRDRANKRSYARSESEKDVRDHSFAAQVREHRVTHLQCTPSMLRLLLADPESRAALGEVRHLMIGGEALPASLAAEVAAATAASVTNMYGPTETTIWSATHRLEEPVGAIPIGRPIANTSVYVLDRFRQPLPIGLPGELFVGGDGVTRGYHDRPDLTSERFVQDPFRGAETRMYRTGDLVRFRHDGVLDFLGRTDSQVKVRGYRVELGEIETALDRHPDVGASAVLLREDEPGDQRLVAYVVMSNGKLDEGALRTFLRAALPEYMVPGHVVPVLEMPLTPNGKVNRLALAVTPLATLGTVQQLEVEPDGDLERSIADAWRAVLKIDRVGAEDNFFDVGGHSLLVVQLHRVLGETLDRSISLVDLYRFPTIRNLAEHLDADATPSVLAESGSRGDRRREAMGRRRRGGRG